MFNKKAFSLIEVVVAAVIFTLAVAGTFAAVGSIKNMNSAQSSGDMTAVLYGQNFLEHLRSEVSAVEWSGSGDLSLGMNKTIPALYAANFPGYSGTYDVEAVAGGNSRKVTLHIVTP